MPKIHKFRVSFTNADGAVKRVRIPAFYALSLVRSNIARKVAETEVLLYKGYQLHIDKRENEFGIFSDSPPSEILCQWLYQQGLAWEASNLAGKVQSTSFHKRSLSPFTEQSQFTDRHLVLSGRLSE